MSYNYMPHTKCDVAMPSFMGRLKRELEGGKMNYTQSTTPLYVAYNQDTRAGVNLGSITDYVSRAYDRGFTTIQEEMERIQRQLNELSANYSRYEHVFHKATIGDCDNKPEEEPDVTEDLQELLYN